MDHLGEILSFLFSVAVVVVFIYLVVLFSRLVTAHERVADALESLSRKFRNDAK